MWRAVAVIAPEYLPRPQTWSLGPWRDTLMTTPFAQTVQTREGGSNRRPTASEVLPRPERGNTNARTSKRVTRDLPIRRAYNLSESNSLPAGEASH